MKSEQYNCDVCLRLKGQANHWWKAQMTDTFHIYPWGFRVEAHGDGAGVSLLHFCSRECLFKKLGEFLSR